MWFAFITALALPAAMGILLLKHRMFSKDKANRYARLG
jgi:hypothetical protein